MTPPPEPRELLPYIAVELLSVDSLQDATTGAPSVGITVFDGRVQVGFCLSLNDASMLLRQTREAFAEFAATGEYPDAE